MKLFGSSRWHLHGGERKPNQVSEEKKPDDRVVLFSAPIWKKLRRPLLIVGCILLFFLVVLLAYSIWEKPPAPGSDGPSAPLTPRPQIQEPVEETVNPVTVAEQTEETPEPEQTAEPLPTGHRENCYTFAVLAYDQYMANTDTILVGMLDTGAGTLDLVHIPQDTLVNVSWGVKKLATVLAGERNDPDRFLEHLGNLIGYTVDCYAVVDMKAVEKLVDCIGGVYYNVPRDMDYDDPAQALSIHIPKGTQRLNGEDAVKVLRYRLGNEDTGYVNGDLGRISTQQDFLAEMMSQFLKSGNIPNLNAAIDLFQSGVQTNMTSNNMAFFAREFLQLDMENVRFHTMPWDGISIRGGSYLQVSIDEWIAMLNTYLNPFYEDIAADNLNILQENGKLGAISTTGEEIPMTSFYNYNDYTG